MAGFCTAYQKAGIQRGVRIQNAQLAEIPPTFQRAFLNWECVSPAVVFPYFSLDRGGKSGVLFRNLKRVALSSAKTRAMPQRTLGEPRIGRIGRELVVR